MINPCDIIGFSQCPGSIQYHVLRKVNEEASNECTGDRGITSSMYGSCNGFRFALYRRNENEPWHFQLSDWA